MANFKSEQVCANLIYSIRKSGCRLPIRLIPFGGTPVKSGYILEQAEACSFEQFPIAGRKFVEKLSSVLTGCPKGYLHRFLSWFGDWDEFIYSDNDIVALMNWERLFHHLGDGQMLHADEEYTTVGRFNYRQPDKVERIFGAGALTTAFTAGHFVARRDAKMVKDMEKAVEWFRQNPEIPKLHDQALLHIASLLGGWKMVNLCKPPYHWLSSWWGDYKNSLALIQAMQSGQGRQISHVHFSGGAPSGIEPAADFLHSHLDAYQRTVQLTKLGVLELSGWTLVRRQSKRVKTGLSRRLKKVFQQGAIS